VKLAHWVMSWMQRLSLKTRVNIVRAFAITQAEHVKTDVAGNFLARKRHRAGASPTRNTKRHTHDHIQTSSCFFIFFICYVMAVSYYRLGAQVAECHSPQTDTCSTQPQPQPHMPAGRKSHSSIVPLSATLPQARLTHAVCVGYKSSFANISQISR
jgi:hypothetical protein